MLSDILIRVRALMRRDDVERELDEELRFHFEEQVEKFVKEGVPRDEARRRARLEFGGAELIKEECREARGVHFVETLAQDVHYALRMMRKSPGVMAVIVISLALGVGANTAIFSVVDGLLMRPLPVAAPDQITVLAVQQKDAPVGSSGFSYPELIDFRRQAGAFSDVFGVVLGSVQVTVDDSPDQCFANYVTGNFFSSLGMKPTLGRLILPSEGETPGEPAIAVLDYAYWERRFNGDPGVVGGRVRVNGKSARIIGVAPSQFHGMFSLFETDVYLPMSSVSLEESAGAFWTSRDRRRILAFGRLKPGISLREAQSSLDVITARLANQYPATDRWFTIRAVPEKSARPIPYANNSFVAMSGLFLLLAACVLLLACMNVENILLARGTAREREMGIRAALGAGRARLICQMLTESILLAILGGGGGIVLGVWANHWTNSLRFQNIPLQVDSALDWRVFTFAAASVLFTGIFVGLLPALRASSGDVNSALHEGAQRDSQGIHLPGFRNILVIAQAAVSLALLVAAGLLVRSLQKVEGFDLGFDPGHLLNVIMDPHEAGYGDAQTTLFYREIEARVRALPGVQSASFASYVPMGGFPSKASVSLEGRPIRPDQKAPGVLFNCVDPAYFQTMRIALLRGRNFAESDDKSGPQVAIVNQTMAERFWPREDPIGKRFSMDGNAGAYAEVIGVAGDGKYQTISEDAQPFFYVPLAQNFSSKRALQIRTIVPPESLVGPVKEQITHLAAGLSIMDIETMKHLLEGALGLYAYRVAAALAAVLGLIGLILAIVGVYGVVSFAASQRTREIGIRMALGANSHDVLNLIWLQAVRLVFAGIAIGMAIAWALTRTMTHLVIGISTSDPVTYIVAAVLLAGVALGACWIPARRAMRVDPMVALRHE